MAEANTRPLPRGTKEAFATFFLDPSRDAFRALLVDSMGEAKHIDFKREWLKGAQLSKHILGIANTGPGCLIIGVDEKENGTTDPVGLNAFKDKSDVLKSIKGYLPNAVLERVSVHDLAFEASEFGKLEGKLFQVLIVEYSPDHIPFIALKDGEGIREGAIYVRVEAGTAEATHDQVQNLINDRLATGNSTSEEIDLKNHFEQLRVLYSEAPRSVSVLTGLMGNSFSSLFAPHPEAPTESYEKFVSSMIEHKKALIAHAIGVSGSYNATQTIKAKLKAAGIKM